MDEQARQRDRHYPLRNHHHLAGFHMLTNHQGFLILLSILWMVFFYWLMKGF